MSLLRDGTVVRKLPPRRSYKPEDDASGGDLPSHETAPIEEVTQVTEGLNNTITFTFKAVEGETLQPRPPNSGYTILCAEDNRVCQMLLGKMFGKFGQDFVMTENGERVVEMYMSSPERFPCILMDIAMPILDGLRATSLIRTFESTRPGHRRALIVGLMASYSQPHVFSPHGFDLFMYKPVRVGELYDIFMGGPETNLAMLYGSLTEQEKSAYPRLVEDGVLRDDPRSNAIKDELKRRRASTEGTEDEINPALTKLIVKVVVAGKNEQTLS